MGNKELFSGKCRICGEKKAKYGSVCNRCKKLKLDVETLIEHEPVLDNYIEGKRKSSFNFGAVILFIIILAVIYFLMQALI